MKWWRLVLQRWRELYRMSDCCAAPLYVGTSDGLTPESFCLRCNQLCCPPEAPFWRRLEYALTGK